MFLCNFKGTLPIKKIEKFKKQFLNFSIFFIGKVPLKKIEKFKKQFLASKKKQNQIKEQQKSENDSLKSKMESD